MPHEDGASQTIPIARLQQMLLDPSVPDADIRPYLIYDPTDSTSFRPSVRINPNAIAESATESALAIPSLNAVERWRRQRRYRRRTPSPNEVRVVAEGDSWFQFPFLLDDVIDHLMGDHAVLCLSGAGHLLTEMIEQNEVAAAVIAEEPHLVLLSAGGNDLLGGGRLTEHIEPFDPARPVAEYIGPRFEAFLARRMADYRDLVLGVLAARPGIDVYVHSYGYAIPQDGRWLGRPLTRFGLTTPSLQRELVALMVDRLHDALVELSEAPALGGRVSVIDARSEVAPAAWWDELHPTSEGYAKVAERFRTAIAAERPGRGRTESLAPSAALSGEAERARRAAERIFADDLSEAALIAEAGRRGAIASLGRDVDAMTVPASSVEGLFGGFTELGERIVARVEREAYALLCGSADEDREDRAALREAFNYGSAALAGHLAALLTGGFFSLPAATAAVVAPIIIKRFANASWEAVCASWTERLDRAPLHLGGAVAEEPRAHSLGAAAVPPSPDQPVAEAPPPMPTVRRVRSGAPGRVSGSRRLMELLTARPKGAADASDFTPEGVGGGPDLSEARVRQSLEMAEASLRTHAERSPAHRVGREEVDALIRDARSGMDKLGREGARADVTPQEGFAIEAVVLTDGTRPILFVREDALDTEGVALGAWAGAVTAFSDEISSVARSVGRIETPMLPQRLAGTGFAIAEGLVLTNRHVLEVIAEELRTDDGVAWRLRDQVHIDFGGEHGSTRRRRFRVVDVAYAGPQSIDFAIDFNKADVAVLRCEEGPDGAEFPAPVTLAAGANLYEHGRDVYVIGYPGRPLSFRGDGEARPPVGHEHVDVINTMFADTFGVKRWAPGRMTEVPGSLDDDVHGWVTAHDCSTLGGNSGSCVVEFAMLGDRAVGLHFGGMNREENWAHALAAFSDTLTPLAATFR